MVSMNKNNGYSKYNLLHDSPFSLWLKQLHFASGLALKEKAPSWQWVLAIWGPVQTIWKVPAQAQIECGGDGCLCGQIV